MAGIERIKITDTNSSKGAYRFRQSEKSHEAINKLYRIIFNFIGMPLESGYETIECSNDDIESAYDRLLGVDVIFRHVTGQTSAAQEKALTYWDSTVTVEYYNNPRIEDEGDWFTLKANYYFVGYDRDKNGTIGDFILLDWVATQRATAQNRIPWRVNSNKKDGARANFKHVHFNAIPEDCVIARRLGTSSFVNAAYRELMTV